MATSLSRLNILVRRASWFGTIAVGISAFTGACGDDGDDGSTVTPSGGSNGQGGSNSGGSNSGGSNSGGSNSGGSNSGGSGGSIIQPDGGGASGSGGSGGVCSTNTAKATLQPLYLAFAYDASASMGNPEYASYYIKAQKWDPIEAAAKAFFSQASPGVSASLTFFPTGRSDQWCGSSPYQNPRVPMTALSGGAGANVFSQALDQAEVAMFDNVATPTQGVMNGVISYVTAQRQTRPGKYVIVLVTDGVPDQCPNDSATPIVTAIQNARNGGVNTYVIGVKNPAPGPNALGVLDQFANAGGTNTAFLIDTGNPEATTTAFRNRINSIRTSNVPCNVAIPPPPPGVTFDKRRVAVKYTSGTKPAVTLKYDSACTTPNSWKYNNEQSPTQINLCPNTCPTIQADPQAAITVDFTCENVIEIPD